RMHPDLSGLEKTGASAEASGHVRRRDAAGFDVAGVAEAAQLALPEGFFLSLLEPRDVRHLHHRIEGRVIVSGVVAERDRRLIGKLPDEVLAADAGWIELHFARSRFDQPLDDVGRLGT